jgi:hypothetical protein
VIPHLLQGKQHPETLLKIWARSNGRIKNSGPSESVLWSGATRPPPHRVAISHLLYEKQHPKTLLKIWARSNDRIKKWWLLRTGILV